MNNAKAGMKAFYETRYDSYGTLPLVEVETRRRERLQPCYSTGRDHKSDNKMAFHDLIVRTGGWQQKSVLDYGCGDGTWSVYFALTGARQVTGFDIATSGIHRGDDRVRRQGLSDKVALMVMDAKDLAFPAESFDMVFGDGVLCHLVGHPHVFAELHRVMKPGAKAYFKEGLADFPPFRLYWKLKKDNREQAGPVRSEWIRRSTEMFSDVQVIGDTFIYSVKTLLWKPSLSPFRRLILKSAKKADDVLFAMCPPLRRWGSFAYIVLTK
jgi:ubiquinone/menaquinone biosynthesis C-methylase UbiE